MVIGHERAPVHPGNGHDLRVPGPPGRTSSGDRFVHTSVGNSAIRMVKSKTGKMKGEDLNEVI